MACLLLLRMGWYILSVFVQYHKCLTCSEIRHLVVEAVDSLGFRIWRRGFEDEDRGTCWVALVGEQRGLLVGEVEVASRVLDELSGGLASVVDYSGRVSVRSVAVSSLVCGVDMFLLCSVVFGGWEDGITFQDSVCLSPEEVCGRDALRLALLSSLRDDISVSYCEVLRRILSSVESGVRLGRRSLLWGRIDRSTRCRIR